MSRRLWWRMQLRRVGRTHERALKLATGVGFGGLAVTILLRALAPDPGKTWLLIFMGLCLALSGAGHALLGGGATVHQYASGQSDEMPALTKFATGLLASGGGLLLAASGILQVIA